MNELREAVMNNPLTLRQIAGRLERALRDPLPALEAELCRWISGRATPSTDEKRELSLILGLPLDELFPEYAAGRRAQKPAWRLGGKLRVVKGGGENPGRPHCPHCYGDHLPWDEGACARNLEEWYGHLAAPCDEHDR